VRGSFDQGKNEDITPVPPAKIRASYIYQDYSWRAAINLTHAASQTRARVNKTTTNGYNRWDESLFYQRESCSIFPKGQNLSNQTIRNSKSL
jgi:hypothetical protein